MIHDETPENIPATVEQPSPALASVSVPQQHLNSLHLSPASAVEGTKYKRSEGSNELAAASERERKSKGSNESAGASGREEKSEGSNEPAAVSEREEDLPSESASGEESIAESTDSSASDDELWRKAEGNPGDLPRSELIEGTGVFICSQQLFDIEHDYSRRPTEMARKLLVSLYGGIEKIKNLTRTGRGGARSIDAHLLDTLYSKQASSELWN